MCFRTHREIADMTDAELREHTAWIAHECIRYYPASYSTRDPDVRDIVRAIAVIVGKAGEVVARKSDAYALYEETHKFPSTDALFECIRPIDRDNQMALNVIRIVRSVVQVFEIFPPRHSYTTQRGDPPEAKAEKAEIAPFEVTATIMDAQNLLRDLQSSAARWNSPTSKS